MMTDISSSPSSSDNSTKPTTTATTDNNYAPNETVHTSIPSIRYEWYQTNDQIVFSLLLKNADLNLLEKTISSTHLHFQYPGYAPLQLNLFSRIEVPNEPASTIPCSLKSTRIEFQFRKSKPQEHWPNLILLLPPSSSSSSSCSSNSNVVSSSMSIPTSTGTYTDPKVYPSSAKKPKNWWDQLPKELINDDDDDQNVNALFQKIYKNASDDTKRAMIKSYTESNGTCLSTNWEEVSKSKVQVRPPDGMEVKPFEK